MRIETFKRLFFGDSTLSRYQDNVTSWAAQFEPCPFLIGSLIETTITTADTIINHKLQKQPEGFLVLDQTANSVIWRTSWNNETITLRASANVSVKIWVF